MPRAKKLLSAVENHRSTASEIEIAHQKPHLGNIQPLKGMTEPHVEIINNIKPHLGISKPVGALNKLHVNISLL